MDKYIKVEAAKRAMAEAVGSGLEVKYLKQILEELPAEDVAPVRHRTPIAKRIFVNEKYFERVPNVLFLGQPVYNLWYRPEERSCAYCPECGERLCSRSKNYCPKCGAKMDEGREAAGP